MPRRRRGVGRPSGWRTSIRKALVVIAKGQEEMLELLESGAGAGGAGRGEDGDEDEEEEEGDSDLADAADPSEVEEEDHGNGDGAALIPEVLPAGRRGGGDA